MHQQCKLSMRAVVMTKPFDQNLYDADDSAKNDLIEWLKVRGFDAWVNPDQYGIDVLGIYDDRYYAFEVEVKHNWKDEIFPFDSVHYSARKRKFVLPDCATFFVTMNDQRTHMLMVNGKDFMAGKVIQKNTIYTTAEWFVEVPTSRCIFRALEKESL